MTLTEALKQTDFTATESNVVQYIRENLDRIPDMNIGELAQATFSSNSTIIRICRKLHCEGYRELKHLIAKEAESQKYQRQTVDFEEPFHSDQSITEIVSTMGSLYKEGIDIINSCLRYTDLKQAARIISHAKRIFIYCIGDTKTTARTFINQLLKLDYYPICATDNHEEFWVSRHITEEDCVMLISYRGRSIHDMNVLPVIRNSRCKIISITANEKSLSYKIANVRILIPDMENEAKVSTFYSQLAFTYILNILYTLLYLDSTEAERRKE